MDIRRLTVFIGIILAFCASLIIIFLIFLSGNTQLRDGLIAETVGGGILGSIVAATFFYLQEVDEYHANKKKSKSFYDDKLILDLREAFDRSESPWNFSGLNKFYYDNSRINSIFDIYENNFGEINEYSAYYTEDKLITVFKEFYREARKGYVLGEKLEGEIYQVVRSENHKRGLISANDPSYQAYLKGHLFAKLPDDMIFKYLEWTRLPDAMPQVIEVVNNRSEIAKLIADVMTVREKLLKKEKIIKSLISSKAIPVAETVD